METENSVAKAEVTFNAPPILVWDALVNPVLIEKYMMGANVVSDWQKGSEITWTGEMNGKYYEDKGEILQIEPYKILQYSHFSNSSGAIDLPENYHIVTIELSEENDKTILSLFQDNTSDDKARAESEKNWNAMLGSMKKLVEGRA